MKVKMITGMCVAGIAVLIISCAQHRVKKCEDKLAPPATEQSEKYGKETSEKKTEESHHDQTQITAATEYTLGVDDIIKIDLFKPEQLQNIATVAPDGMITFPYIGNVQAKGRTISQVQQDIQTRLANGYMKYPIVAVSLKASRSRKFYVYGEVLKPGAYPIEENMTALRAISMAGGFSRFGSSSRVKVLRPRKKGAGYKAIKVHIKAVMEGDSDKDLPLAQGDIVVVSEGVF